MLFNSWTLFQLFLFMSVRSLPSPSIARNFGGGLLCKCTRNFFIWELWCLENIVKLLFVFSRCSVGNLRTGRPNGQLLVISNARILCICLPTYLLYEYVLILKLLILWCVTVFLLRRHISTSRYIGKSKSKRSFFT